MASELKRNCKVDLKSTSEGSFQQEEGTSQPYEHELEDGEIEEDREAEESFREKCQEKVCREERPVERKPIEKKPVERKPSQKKTCQENEVKRRSSFKPKHEHKVVKEPEKMGSYNGPRLRNEQKEWPKKRRRTSSPAEERDRKRIRTEGAQQSDTSNSRNKRQNSSRHESPTRMFARSISERLSESSSETNKYQKSRRQEHSELSKLLSNHGSPPRWVSMPMDERSSGRSSGTKDNRTRHPQHSERRKCQSNHGSSIRKFARPMDERSSGRSTGTKDNRTRHPQHSERRKWQSNHGSSIRKFARPMDERSSGAKKNPTRRPPHSEREDAIGYLHLNDICNEEDQEEAMIKLIKVEKRFVTLLNSEEIRVDLFRLVIKSLDIVCKSKNRSTMVLCMLDKTYDKLLRYHFKDFISKLTELELEDKEGIIIKVINIFESFLQLLGEKVKHAIPLLELQQIANQLHEEGNITELTLKRVQKANELLRKVKQVQSTNSQLPPDNFRDIKIQPNEVDFRPGGKPFLRENVINGAYSDAEHYLDVHFRLLREDFLNTLRDGIKELRMEQRGSNAPLRESKARNKRSAFVYRDVTILNPVCNRKGSVYRVRINLKKGKLEHVNWRKSKRLKYGALLCLSIDSFETLFFGTVENRDFDSLQCGELEIRFEDCGKNVMRDFIQTKQRFQMIESEAYFESYRHNLSALTEFTEENLPFKEHIVYVKTDISPPKYIFEEQNWKTESGLDPNLFCTIAGPVYTPPKTEASSSAASPMHSPSSDSKNAIGAEEEIQATEKSMEFASIICREEKSAIPENEERKKNRSTTVQVTQLDQWPSKEMLCLDESQYRACQLALTKRFALIQGPPGTGKTYVGLKIAEVLLDNRTLWNGERRNHPILMVAYTNHALDQFIMGLKNREGIVRVGGRSKIKELEDFNLRRLRNARGSFEKYRIRDEIRRIENEYQPKIASKFIDLGNKAVLSLGVLRTVMKWKHFLFFKGEDGDTEILKWLGVTQVCCNRNTSEKKPCYDFFSKNIFDCDDDDEDEVRVNQINVACYQHEAEEPKDLEKRLGSDQRMTEQEEERVRDLSKLCLEDRWNLYRLWRVKLEWKCLQRIYDCQDNYYEVELSKLHDVEQDSDFEIMRNARVIAMTTTCAARYHTILQRISPKILLVEEAAEVLEAHILTSIPFSCEHVILIGDHQQLRPSCNEYQLSRKYNLNISLFERLVNLGFPCERLSEQHRMRPEIASLMKHIYQNLDNHPSVHTFENYIRGMKHNLYFIDHRFYEELNLDTESHINNHEAMYLAKLCRFLLQQDYQETKITVLTPYLGQMFKIRDCLKEEEIEQIRISTIDNYQGEENDIILLSLVRSNEENRIGFVQDINRACVALSRARMGLYVIGNFEGMTKSSEIWRNVRETVRESGQFGMSLPLVCAVHKTEIMIKSPNEFIEKVPCGGCTEPCRSRLKCGHACTLPCHPSDPDHFGLTFNCLQPCTKKRQGCDHICANKCWETCEKQCYERVSKVLTCGHTKHNTRCRDQHPKCEVRCEKILTCGHQCQKHCGESCTLVCNELIKHTDWPCGHEVTAACSATPLNCAGPCGRLECGHECSGNCGECLQGRVHKRCKHKCTRTLLCSHECKSDCSVACPPCQEPCKTSCKHSNCNKKCGELCTQCSHDCEWKCKHQRCTRKCGEICDRPRCDVHCKRLIPKCQHKCRGLCNERCVCLKCDKENIQEIFGTEEFDDVNVRFIRLQDCDHIFEVSGMDTYMKSDDGEISLKTCPMCRTPILKTTRYNNAIKSRLADISKVKDTILKEHKPTSTNGEITEKLTQYIGNIPKNCDRHRRNCENVLKKSIKSRNNYELVMIENKVNLLTRCKKVTEKIITAISTINDDYPEIVKEKLSPMFLIMEFLRTQRILGCTLQREIDDINVEISRQHLSFEVFYLGFQLQTRKIPIEKEHEELLDMINEKLSKSERVDESELDSLSEKVKDARTQYPVNEPTPEEKVLIVKAIGLSKGHWFKCPQGHIYAIGECGGAMEKRRCPECNAVIGGTQHTLVEGNELASEMDGAQFAAWSEQANLGNYGNIDEFLG